MDLSKIKRFTDNNVVHNAMELFIGTGAGKRKSEIEKQFYTNNVIEREVNFKGHLVHLILERRYEDEVGKYTYNIRSRSLQYNSLYGILMWLGCRNENLRFDYSAIHINNISKSEQDGISSGTFAIQLATTLCDLLNARVSFLFDRAYISRKGRKSKNRDKSITIPKYTISLSLFKLMERDSTWYEKYGFTICFTCLSDMESDTSNVQSIYERSLQTLKYIKLIFMLGEIEKMQTVVEQIFSQHQEHSENELKHLSMILTTCVQATAMLKKYTDANRAMTFQEFIVKVWHETPRDVALFTDLFLEDTDRNSWMNMENNFHLQYKNKEYKLTFIDVINVVGFTVNKIVRIRRGSPSP